MMMPEMPEPEKPQPEPPTLPEQARTLKPVRNQPEWRVEDLDALLAQDHPARAIWGFLEQLDLAAFYARIKAITNRPGRPRTDPQVLLGLWLLATVDGVGSARRLARLCEEHSAYRWMSGGVPVNYHTLSDFRVANEKEFSDLLTQIVATLMAERLVTLERVAQDGMRVRASAGAASFRRKGRLKRCLKEAEEQVERLAKEREHPDPLVNKREQQARERAATEREERVRRAIAYLPEAQAAKERQVNTLSRAKKKKVGEARASTTDPDARVMKMADGGYRPAYNVELATDSLNGIIVAVGVVREGTDSGQAVPMEEQVEQRTGERPGDYLMDGGFATRKDITLLEQKGITVYAPVRLPRNRPEEERYLPRQGDSAEVARWRQRMSADEAKEVYRMRGAVAEWANAQVRLHGISQFNVRGLRKVTAVVLMVAVAHNLLRWAALSV